MSGYHGPALAVKVPVGVKGDLTSQYVSGNLPESLLNVSGLE